MPRSTLPAPRPGSRPEQVRAVGVDLGAKRIGIALSDSAGTVATPYEVLRRGPTRQGDHDAILAIVDEADAEVVVVGLPLSLRGDLGPAARSMEAEARQLARRAAVPVVLHDERLTTVEADRSMMRSGTSGKARRKVIDKVAAAVMLQAWLDQGASVAEPL